MPLPATWPTTSGRAVQRWSRVHRLLVATAAGLLIAGVFVAVTSRGSQAAMDYHFYRDIGARWLADGTYYTARQLSGEPYSLEAMVDVLYPPTALVLFVPSVFLPAFLWWLIPLVVLGSVVWTYHPSPWAWVAIAFLVAWPRTFGAVLFGNTDMWVAAAVAGGLRWGWPAAILAVKPPFIPFGLGGVGRRSTWRAGGILLVLSAPLMADYIKAMINWQVDGFGYAAVSLPFALIPIVAWLGREREHVVSLTEVTELLEIPRPGLSPSPESTNEGHSIPVQVVR